MVIASATEDLETTGNLDRLTSISQTHPAASLAPQRHAQPRQHVFRVIIPPGPARPADSILSAHFSPCPAATPYPSPSLIRTPQYNIHNVTSTQHLSTNLPITRI